MKIILFLLILVVSFNVKSHQQTTYEEFVSECTSDLAKFARYKRHCTSYLFGYLDALKSNSKYSRCLSSETPETLLEKLKLLLVNNTKLGKYNFSDGLKESVANICKKKH
ncbi:hypothetical protein JF50_11540 [Pseudoalteromonas luteoviolacea]|uniref:Rap1a immunity protein domain-containing protein n=1 Tax=Pseudoalteromonas luteoviolacea TaxID=43657 RepID=A0A0C1MHZ1_9GAMM|nr:hypothetical protein [Pseudoalteromonas luteoviolacea]KID56564.1 hypothetical protein JF50_11540 [Pseudoalteromonas luteoviolacea]